MVTWGDVSAEQVVKMRILGLWGGDNGWEMVGFGCRGFDWEMGRGLGRRGFGWKREENGAVYCTNVMCREGKSVDKWLQTMPGADGTRGSCGTPVPHWRVCILIGKVKGNVAASILSAASAGLSFRWLAMETLPVRLKNG